MLSNTNLSLSGGQTEHPVKVNIFIKKTLKKYMYYYLMLILPVLYFILFKYGPIYGIIIAFRRYIPGGSPYGESWVGFKYFSSFLSNDYFWRAFKNTIILSFSNIIISMPFPIIFALLLNELRSSLFKSVVQVVSYFPHFISMVVVVGIIKEILSPSTGIVNTFLMWMGNDPIHFVNEPEWFRPIYIFSGIWQNMGWSSLLYLASITNIDPQLYESAEIDGAGRFKKMCYITMPSMLPTIVILLILDVGHILSVGFEKVLLLYTPMTQETGDVISTFVYRMGLESANYSFAAAVGLFDGIAGVLLIYCANIFARKFSETSLW